MPRDLPRGEIPDASDPPAGCAFHPRCPRAFEPCGWTGRDLRTHLEDRWTRLGEEVYEREHRMFTGLDRLAGETEAVLAPHRLHTAGDLAGVLAAARRDAPDDPFWRGVVSVGERDGQAVVRFAEPVVPLLHGRVACHLHHQP